MFTKKVAATVVMVLIAIMGSAQATWVANVGFEGDTVGSTASTQSVPPAYPAVVTKPYAVVASASGQSQVIAQNYADSVTGSTMPSKSLVIQDISNNSSTVAIAGYYSGGSHWNPADGVAYTSFDILVDSVGKNGGYGSGRVELWFGRTWNNNYWDLWSLGLGSDAVKIQHQFTATGITMTYGEKHNLMFGTDFVNKVSSVWLDGVKIQDNVAMISVLGTPPDTTWQYDLFRMGTQTTMSHATANIKYAFDNFTVSNTVPEPATMCLLGLGGLLFARKRK